MKEGQTLYRKKDNKQGKYLYSIEYGKNEAKLLVVKFGRQVKMLKGKKELLRYAWTEEQFKKLQAFSSLMSKGFEATDWKNDKNHESIFYIKVKLTGDGAFDWKDLDSLNILCGIDEDNNLEVIQRNRG